MPTIGVIGLGLIGGSIARRFAMTHDVIGYDPSMQTRAAAEHHGITAVDDVRAACAADIIFVATPLHAMAATLASVGAAVAGRDDVIVTDVGSVKGSVYDWVQTSGLAEKFVLGHPMAGTEFSGFEHADPLLFSGATWVLCSTEQTDAHRWLRLAELLITTFDCTIVSPTPADHDRAVALISHLPHVISTAALNLLAADADADLAAALAAGSFASLTRVAGTNAERTEAMVAENRGATAQHLRALIRDLTQVADALETDQPMSEFFERATQARTRLSHPDAAEEFRLDQNSVMSMLADLGARGRRITAIAGLTLSVTR